MTFFLFCLEELALEVYYKLVQLFDSFNIFSVDNIKLTELRFRDDGVFLVLDRLQDEDGSSLVHVTTPGGIPMFSGDTPDGMFFLPLE